MRKFVAVCLFGMFVEVSGMHGMNLSEGARRSRAIKSLEGKDRPANAEKPAPMEREWDNYADSGSSLIQEARAYRVISRPSYPAVTSQPVNIVSQPKGITSGVGAAFTLSVSATGTTPSYQWRKNGVYIPGATSPSYSVARASVSDSGQYDCLVGNPVSLVTSNAVTVSVVVQSVSFLEQPVNVNTTEGTGFSMKVAVSGTPPLAFQWQKNGVPIEGATSALYSVARAASSDAGAYACVVSNSASQNGVKSQSGIISVKTVPVVVSQPQSLSVKTGTVVSLQVGATGSGSLNYQWRRNGVNITSARSSGYQFLAVGSDSAGNYDCKVTDAGGGSVITAVGVVTVRASSFAGIINRDRLLNGNLGSLVTISVDSRGAFSGKITTGTTSVPFRGQLRETSTVVGAQAAMLAELNVEIPKVGTLSLLLDGEGSNLEGKLSSDLTSAEVKAWRNPWVEVVGNASKLRGLHVFQLSQGDPNSALPQGSGFGGVTVSATTGVATLSGNLADGSPISGSTFVGKNGEIAIYASLYANRGSLVGVLILSEGSTPPIDNTLSGGLTWYKPAPTGKSVDLIYPGGFGPLSVHADGGAYLPPAKGGLVMGLSNSTGNNAKLVFESGGLQSALGQSLRISNPSPSGTTNTFQVPVNPNGVKLTKLDAIKGQFAGEFTLSGSNKKALFNGQIVNIEGVMQGVGYFLLPQGMSDQGAASALKLSGMVELKSP